MVCSWFQLKNPYYIFFWFEESILAGVNLNIPLGSAFSYGDSATCIKAKGKHCLALVLPRSSLLLNTALSVEIKKMDFKKYKFYNFFSNGFPQKMSAHSVQPFGRYWEHIRMFCFIIEIFGYFTINKKIQPITLFKKEILPNS